VSATPPPPKKNFEADNTPKTKKNLGCEHNATREEKYDVSVFTEVIPSLQNYVTREGLFVYNEPLVLNTVITTQ